MVLVEIHPVVYPGQLTFLFLSFFLSFFSFFLPCVLSYLRCRSFIPTPRKPGVLRAFFVSWCFGLGSGAFFLTTMVS
ncbi:hypothetical protein HOY82DRAFT_349090 [Tuber indicum]|nr:hypothetical protein HOY82DRAFT_349090 [Tuber indicum]